jgi:acyl carrier protein
MKSNMSTPIAAMKMAGPTPQRMVMKRIPNGKVMAKGQFWSFPVAAVAERSESAIDTKVHRALTQSAVQYPRRIPKRRVPPRLSNPSVCARGGALVSCLFRLDGTILTPNIRATSLCRNTQTARFLIVTVEEVIRMLIVRYGRADPQSISMSTALATAGVDAIAVAQIVIYLEARFDIVIQVHEATEWRTGDEIVGAVQRLLSNRHREAG